MTWCRRCLPVACAAAASGPFLGPPVTGPGPPALRSPRPPRLLDGGGKTPAVLFGPVSRRRRPPHWGEHRALSGRVGVGTPRRTARAAPLRLWVSPRPGPGAPLRRASLPPACSSSRLLARSPSRRLPSRLQDKRTTPAQSASLPQPRSGRRDVTAVTSSAGAGPVGERGGVPRQWRGLLAGDSGSCSSSFSCPPSFLPPPPTPSHT